jgi:hypothetical protein
MIVLPWIPIRLGIHVNDMFTNSNKAFINFNYFNIKGFEFYNSELPIGEKENLNRSCIYFHQMRRGGSRVVPK